MTIDDTQVLIVGAGPTGLITACTLLAHGVSVRIVDRRPGPDDSPRATVLWSGAMECLLRVGVSEEVADAALPLAGASYWSRRKRVGEMRFGRLEGTAFPGPLCVPQPVTERALHARLTALGGRVEWQAEAIGVTVRGSGAEDGSVIVALRRSDRPVERATARWLIGADGIDSFVRGSVGIAFEGDDGDRELIVADGVVAGPVPLDEAQYHLTPAGILALLPLPDGGHRILADVPVGEGVEGAAAAGAGRTAEAGGAAGAGGAAAGPGAAEGPEEDARSAPPGEELVQRLLTERGPGRLRLRGAWWSHRLRVHGKVARTFRSGPVLLVGDAAHAHTPAGGQGINTGLQDGFDLGWKLAAVLRGCDPALLDSYESERRSAAVQALRHAEQQARAWQLKNPITRAVRDAAMQSFSRTGILERQMLPQLAQLELDHSGSPAVADLQGAWVLPRAVRLGWRVPDTGLIPLHGTKATSLHRYLSAGRHALLAVGEDAAGGLAARAAEALRGRGVEDLVDVLWIRPEGTTSADEEDTGAEVGCDIAVVNGTPAESEVYQGGPWLVYVRPDGVVAGRASVAGVLGLLERLPSRHGLVRIAC
ncbi:FAD-dependent monooxygenase [Allostreptomyces psammosilenae]|uniref:2-polyprenyl-6-methoxyphenol hydroxylase-like FAD-dependent oxidoreductase n=1 Tax=Allostreptomyces psammosilenae TaxID=1892865 RepID=A0A853AD20_9ACTN|nr:FAD-dependent monooxygenase [Allostreptomyces psammosilenae]NYI08232.1 2-polyprenyl-6-methoxyphenol hydroxylase-like FAD-dependent oxidoreductase [Allostreptomyces psammosilenae]